MKTVHKLILKTYLGPMLLTFFIVMFVLIMQFMWRYIDELVGRGLTLGIISELMFYASATLIPMGLPLATLLAAIMTMGNLGENYELLALKSAGISLPRIMKPLFVVVFLVAVSSFFVSNNLVPYATEKMASLLSDIRHQKQNIEFKDGIFFNGIDDMSIRVGHQDKDTKLLNDILIYDTRSTQGKMSTTVADSGYITLSDDKRFLLVTLYNGENYESNRNLGTWNKESDLRHSTFEIQNMVLRLEGYDFQRNETMFNGPEAKNIKELQEGIDSLEIVTASTASASYKPLVESYIFTRDKSLLSDSAQVLKKTPVVLADSIGKLSLQDKKSMYEKAINNARNSRNYYSFDEATSKEALSQLYRYKAEWHNKMSLPVSIIIFFMIGAPLGAIIRKGGLGMPIVVSVLFFVIYYIITLTGSKMAKEGTWSSFMGMWISTFILLPIAIYLTYKATNDSNLFNAEWYIAQYKRIKSFFVKINPFKRK